MDFFPHMRSREKGYRCWRCQNMFRRVPAQFKLSFYIFRGTDFCSGVGCCWTQSNNKWFNSSFPTNWSYVKTEYISWPSLGISALKNISIVIVGHADAILKLKWGNNSCRDKLGEVVCSSRSPKKGQRMLSCTKNNVELIIFHSCMTRVL